MTVDPVQAAAGRFRRRCPPGRTTRRQGHLEGERRLHESGRLLGDEGLTFFRAERGRAEDGSRRMRARAHGLNRHDSLQPPHLGPCDRLHRGQAGHEDRGQPSQRDPAPAAHDAGHQARDHRHERQRRGDAGRNGHVHVARGRREPFPELRLHGCGAAGAADVNIGLTGPPPPSGGFHDNISAPIRRRARTPTTSRSIPRARRRRRSRRGTANGFGAAGAERSRRTPRT